MFVLVQNCINLMLNQISRKLVTQNRISYAFTFCDFRVKEQSRLFG